MSKLISIVLCLFIVALTGCGGLQYPLRDSNLDSSVRTGIGTKLTDGNNRFTSKPVPVYTVRESLKQKRTIHRKTTTENKLPIREYTVKNGDSLYRIAQYFNIDIYELAILNQIPPPFTRIYVGQSLIFPSSARKPIKLAAFKRVTKLVKLGKDENISNKTQEDKHPEYHLPLIPNKGSTILNVTPGIKPEKGKPRSNFALRKRIFVGSALPPVRKGAPFIWPVSGNIISGFGAKSKGLRNDGVNIAAASGTLIFAPRSGTVAYTGNELRGFGHLLLINHGSGWVTAYAHNESVLVKKGDRVKLGQKIARVGKTGS
ncbi:MAG: peptidoglycan DD-metalloendopeptidase family protein, partial [Pseudomonadota bacterium]|nr:peptidoglycan DD-metalloendopeptidase family protein [Pseudomonadota bacterium]